MTVAIVTTPQYPAAGRSTRVDFTVTGTGNYLRGYFTDAPIGSEAKTALINSGASRLAAFTTDAGKPWLFTPDLGGVYTLQIDQLTKGATNYGGGYQDSPDGFLTETVISSTVVTLSVGQKVTQRIGFAGDTATLTLFVIGDTIRATTFDQVGFTSPIVGDAKTMKARTAALNSGVLAAVSALIGQTASTLVGTLSTVFDGLYNAYSNHLTSVVYHGQPDTDNLPVYGDLGPTSPAGLKISVTHLLTLLDRHMRNDNGGSSIAAGGTGTAWGGIGYHTFNRSDWNSALLGLSAGEALDTFVALADVWRAYSSHIANTAVHTVADTVNVPAALPPLLNLHRLFLAEIQKQSPTAPASVNAGVTALVHSAGFEEA